MWLEKQALKLKNQRKKENNIMAKKMSEVACKADKMPKGMEKKKEAPMKAAKKGKKK